MGAFGIVFARYHEPSGAFNPEFAAGIRLCEHAYVRPHTLQWGFTQMKRLLAVLAPVVAALALAACKQTPPANVAAQVNGHAITNAELDKTYQSQYAQQSEGASEDQVMTQKMD